MHIPVLLDEVLHAFEDLHINLFLDGTLGLGGHAKALLDTHPEISTYIGIDRDQNAQNKAKEHLKDFKKKLLYFHGNYNEFDEALVRSSHKHVDAILLDLGVSSLQLDTPERGFSFRFDGPLDMRMDVRQELTAEVILNRWSEEEIANVLYQYGELINSRHWARLICEFRDNKPFKTIQDLLSIRAPSSHKKHHPFTLVFQALRIAVNDELNKLTQVVEGLFSSLKPGGRLAIITFHSLEDRIIKNTFRFLSQKHTELLGTGDLKITAPKGTLLIRRGQGPSDEEVADNPRSRSARLRVIEKL